MSPPWVRIPPPPLSRTGPAQCRIGRHAEGGCGEELAVLEPADFERITHYETAESLPDAAGKTLTGMRLQMSGRELWSTCGIGGADPVSVRPVVLRQAHRGPELS